MPSINTVVDDVTQRIIERSRPSRSAYLERINKLAEAPQNRSMMGCTNLAHAFAASPVNDKLVLHAEKAEERGGARSRQTLQASLRRWKYGQRANYCSHPTTNVMWRCTYCRPYRASTGWAAGSQGTMKQHMRS